jgi:hypothetical protein
MQTCDNNSDSDSDSVSATLALFASYSFFFTYCRYSWKFFISKNHVMVFFPQLASIHTFKDFATISKIVIVLSTLPTTYMHSMSLIET